MRTQFELVLGCSRHDMMIPWQPALPRRGLPYHVILPELDREEHYIRERDGGGEEAAFDEAHLGRYCDGLLDEAGKVDFDPRLGQIARVEVVQRAQMEFEPADIDHNPGLV